MKVTIFKNIRQTTGGEDFQLSQIMKGIKSGYWRQKVDVYRDLPDNTEEQIKKKKQAKTALPYFTGSGTFDKRGEKHIKEHNGRIVLDIDDVDDTDHVKSLVCADDFSEYVFNSLGNKGLGIIVKIDPKKHLESWKALSQYYKKKYNLTVDKATKDVSRARFVSYDPDLFYNENAKTFRLDDHGERAKKTAEKMIQDAKSGEVHANLIKASRLLGGYIGGGFLDEFEAEEFLLQAMSQKGGVVDLEIERKKIQDGINNGKASPITVEQISKNKEQSEEERERWRDIFAYIHECNRNGKKYTDTDIKHICEQFLISETKIRQAFKKVYEDNKEEFGIVDKPEIVKVEVWLSKNWDFAENEITQVAEFKPKEAKKYELLNIDSIYRKMQHAGFKFSLDKLKSLLRSDFIRRYNPFVDYFEGLDPWDGKTDYISELASYIKVKDQEFFTDQFKKTLVRCIGCSLYGVENRIVFVLVGEKQSTGKSTFLRNLNPFGSKYYTEAPMHNNKDSSFALAENFIYNLEELASLSNIDVNRLKSIISMASIKERKAYARDAVEQPRRSNFFASTNKTEFLTDTENTRWLCFDLLRIDWGYKKAVDIRKVWAQAFALYKDPNFDDQLSQEEAEARDKKNKDYEINDYEKELIKRFFKPCAKNEGKFYGNADILDVLQADGSRKLESRFIGKNMVQLGFERGVKKLNGHTVRGYFAKKIFSSYVEPETVTSKKLF